MPLRSRAERRARFASSMKEHKTFDACARHPATPLPAKYFFEKMNVSQSRDPPPPEKHPPKSFSFHFEKRMFHKPTKLPQIFFSSLWKRNESYTSETFATLS